MQRNKRTSSTRTAKRTQSKASPSRAASSKTSAVVLGSLSTKARPTVNRSTTNVARSSAIATTQKRASSSVAARRQFTNVFSSSPTEEWSFEKASKTPVPVLEPYSDADTIVKAVDSYKQSCALPIEHSPFGGLGQIIKENGKLKFLTFLTIGLASKEIYQIDAGTLNLFNTSIVLFSYYVALQGSYVKSYEEFRRDIVNRYQDALRTKDAILEAGIRHCEALLGKPDVVRDVNKAYQEAHDALTEANVRRDQLKHKEAIESKLAALHFAEQSELRAKAEATKNAALDYLRANAITDQVKADVLKEALSLVGVQEGNKGKNFKALQSLYKEAMKQAK